MSQVVTFTFYIYEYGKIWLDICDVWNKPIQAWFISNVSYVRLGKCFALFRLIYAMTPSIIAIIISANKRRNCKMTKHNSKKGGCKNYVIMCGSYNSSSNSWISCTKSSYFIPFVWATNTQSQKLLSIQTYTNVRKTHVKSTMYGSEWWHLHTQPHTHTHTPTYSGPCCSHNSVFMT